ncbi:hypothetical protein G6F43_014008 [Rhizopus delemar]|nr:hypothetical protein G6F43_014008 [Rhizopus delemar]
MVAAPKLRRNMAAACRPVRIPVEVTNPEETMAVIEEEDINTTAVYSKVNIGDKSIKALIDCGAAKTCMSKALADTLGLYIDAASESIFTLGNGTKQPALGITLPQKIVHFEPPFTHFVLNLLRIIPNQHSAQTIMKHCFSVIYYTVNISRAMRKCWKISNQKSKSK